MPALSKTGSTFVIGFSLPKSLNPDADGLVVVNAPSVRDLQIIFSMNALPEGKVTCVLNHDTAIPVGGAYGFMRLADTNNGANDMDIGIYVKQVNQEENTADSVVLTFDFIVGSKLSDMKLINFACTGTSIAAMKECITRAGMTPLVKYMDNGKNADLMTWRLINGNMDEHLNYILSHSYVPSDIVYWGLDETTGKVVISTFNTEKASKSKSFLFYSTDSMTTTTNAAYRPKNAPGTTVYKYGVIERGDNTSVWRGQMFPNLVVDTTNNNGEKETGDCGGECLDVIMSTAGATPIPKAMKPPKGSAGVYSEPKLAMAFPQNGHKKFAVAETIRGRLLSEYGRVAKVRIYNHLGPRVGSCVYLVVPNSKIREGDVMPDRDYTARYIVMRKVVSKVTQTSAGNLGNTKNNMTNEYETFLELATNFPYKNPTKEYQIVTKAVNGVTASIKK